MYTVELYLYLIYTLNICFPLRQVKPIHLNIYVYLVKYMYKFDFIHFFWTLNLNSRIW